MWWTAELDSNYLTFGVQQAMGKKTLDPPISDLIKKLEPTREKKLGGAGNFYWNSHRPGEKKPGLEKPTGAKNSLMLGNFPGTPTDLRFKNPSQKSRDFGRKQGIFMFL